MALLDQSAVVFGASGSIGSALVRQLAASGQYGTVYAGARGPLLDLPKGAAAFQFELTDEETIAAAARSFAAPPALVIVATGTLHDPSRGIAPEKSWRMIDPAAMARLMAINVIGPALIAKHLLPLLPRDRRAVFAALSARVGSISDNRLGGWHSYRAAKAALNMLVANFAIECRRSHPLAVIAAVHPGTVDTALSAPFRRGLPEGQVQPPAAAAAALLATLAKLSPDQSGGLYAWDGSRLPW